MKEKWKTTVPVYMNFFNRPEVLAEVFKAVKKAKPQKLFLACDGAREGNLKDIENTKKCKEIVSDIDWECEVYHNYSDINLGCGMRMYSGISWAFEYVDRLIILEDDCVPSQDFFPFCEELLERYKNDCRIHMISAMNHLGVYDKTPNSYFFGGGCCWGWATWKRCWEQFDYEMTFLNDEYSMQCVEKKFPYYSNARKIGNERKELLEQGKRLTAWTYQSGMAAALNDQFSIIPNVNLITNIGLTTESSHATNDIKKLSRKTQQYFNAPVYKMVFPLKHPKYMIEDRIYFEEVRKKYKTTLFSFIEGITRRLIYAEKDEIKQMINKIPKKFKKMLERVKL